MHDSLRAWRIPIAIALLAIAAALLAGSSDWLRYERLGLQKGEWWRLWTGHIAHLGWIHLGFNLGGLLIVWLLFRREFSAPSWMQIILFSGLGTSAGLYFFDPAVSWYVGLSGVLHGLAVAGALGLMRSNLLVGIFWIGVVSVKLLVEQFGGSLSLMSAVTSANVIIDAHLYGAISGFIGLGFLRDRFRNPPKHS